MGNIDLQGLSPEERKQLLDQLQREENQQRQGLRKASESLRAEFLRDVFAKVERIVSDVASFKEWLDGESAAFQQTMTDYGQTRFDGQRSYTVTDGSLKLEIQSNQVKTFDERADMAAERLIEYLKGYMKQSSKGADDPIYQLAMTLLERNKQGKLDYKSISKLYQLEDKFDGAYSEIMALFKESNVVQGTALNYYFSKRGVDGVWRRLEPSFCRL
ncbi:MAG: DUF3164 family protein [Bacteroidaceae bacterium]|nr:DUF3164 family protein [Bacteroidaceae bacterium]